MTSAHLWSQRPLLKKKKKKKNQTKFKLNIDESTDTMIEAVEFK